MDGIINLYKPPGMTSAKALYRVREITGVRKSGHAGTLDSVAEGVLVLCMGKATKLVEASMDQPKVYRAIARLDVTSASFDSGREVVPVAVAERPDGEQLRAACGRFEGRISQVPPVLSALKVDGWPAYRLARIGRLPALEARDVQVYWLHVHRYEWPLLEFEIACGRGTYVRALIRDLGRRLGTGGCLIGLTRRAVGPFEVDDAWSFERLEQARETSDYLMPLECARELLAVRPIPVPPRPATPGV